MKRTREHAIGTEAVNAIKTLIPSAWIINEHKDDYGLDLMVQIVEREEVTGKMFFIQSKGTDKDIDETFKYQLEIDHIKDYKNLAIPILFIVYSTKKNTFWAKWGNNLINGIKLKKESQKTVTITFDKSNMINADFFNNLPSVFSNEIPFKINITSNPIDKESIILDEVLREWINHYYGKFIEFNNHLLPISFTIEYIRDNNLMKVVISDIQKGNIELSIDTSDSYFKRPIFDDSDCHISIRILLLHISKILWKVDIKGTIAILTQTVTEIYEDTISTGDLFDIMIEALNSLDYTSIDNLCNEVKEKKRLDLLQIINMSILLSGKTKENLFLKLYRDNLIIAQHIVEDNYGVGVFCYNLANSYRGKGEYHQSSYYYQQARKYEPLYLTRSYWWGEYAGILYLTGHYKFAEAFYKKSFKLNPKWNEPLIYELIGDALFQQWKIKDALTEYNKYFEHTSQNNKSVGQQVLLKTLGCEYLISQSIEWVSPQEPAMKTEDITEDDMEIDSITGILKSNPLNPLSWFNAGINYSSKNEKELSMYAFLICWCIDENDYEALINCFIMSLNTKIVGIIVSLIDVIYNRMGANGFNMIAEKFTNQPNMNERQKEFWFDIIKEIYDNLDANVEMC